MADIMFLGVTVAFFGLSWLLGVPSMKSPTAL